MILLPTYKFKVNSTNIKFIFGNYRCDIGNSYNLDVYATSPVSSIKSWISKNGYIRVPYGFTFN